MRLNRKVLAVLIILGFAVALAVLFNNYFQLVADEENLEGRLTVAEARIPALTPEKAGLEEERKGTRAALTSAQAAYPREIHSIEYGEHIWDIVRQCNVTMTSLPFPRPAPEQEGAVAFQVVPFTLRVSGTLSEVFEFIRVLRTDDRFASTRVHGISLSIDGEAVSATISITIYGHSR